MLLTLMKVGKDIEKAVETVSEIFSDGIALVMNRNDSISGHVTPVSSRNGPANCANTALDRRDGINKFNVNPETPPLPPSVTSIPKRTRRQCQSMKQQSPHMLSKDHNPHFPATVQNMTLNNSQQSRFSDDQFKNSCHDSSIDYSHPHVRTTLRQITPLPPLSDTNHPMVHSALPSVPKIDDAPLPLPQRPHKHTELDFEDRFFFHNVKEFPKPGPMEIQPIEKVIKTSSKATKLKNDH